MSTMTYVQLVDVLPGAAHRKPARQLKDALLTTLSALSANGEKSGEHVPIKVIRDWIDLSSSITEKDVCRYICLAVRAVSPGPMTIEEVIDLVVRDWIS